VGDATQLRFPPRAFDKVLCSEVIEHIPDADGAIAEIHRVLKPGGRLVLSTPNSASWYGFDRYVLWTKVLRRRWDHPFDNWRNMGQLCSLLERHGFRITSSGAVCYLPGFLVTYRLPTFLQRALIRCVRHIEGPASRRVPRSGYLLVVTAEKSPSA
jgi:SAM-dependent methyltransferase